MLTSGRMSIRCQRAACVTLDCMRSAALLTRSRWPAERRRRCAREPRQQRGVAATEAQGERRLREAVAEARREAELERKAALQEAAAEAEQAVERTRQQCAAAQEEAVRKALADFEAQLMDE